MKKIFLVLLLIIVVLLVVRLFLPQTSAQPQNFKQIWSANIDKLGARKAYEQLQEVIKKDNFNSQHLEAHQFGQLLYQKDGLKDIIVCDNAFSFGCYHGFFAAAVADKGIGIVGDLNQSCLDSFGPLGTGCQHGIGHGLTEFYGIKRLADALSQCSKIQNLSYLGCSSGVFMEYNSPTILTETSAEVTQTKVDLQNPFSYCSKIETKYQSSCVFEMVQYLLSSKQTDIKSLEDLCDHSESRFKKSCFLGLGTAVSAWEVFDKSKSLVDCNSVSVQDRSDCLAGLSWGFYSMNPQSENKAQFCQYAAPAEQSNCQSSADLTNIKIE